MRNGNNFDVGFFLLFAYNYEFVSGTNKYFAFFIYAGFKKAGPTAEVLFSQY